MPGNRYRREYGWFSRTLGQLVDSRMALVAYLRSCNQKWVLYPADFIERFGHDRPARVFAVQSCRGRITSRRVKGAAWPRQSLCFALSGTRGDVLRSTWSGLVLPRRKFLRTARRCLTLTGRRS